ncbi:MAG: hypothetical protein K9H25_16250 [Rhodospirillum sp.]|nr:hypothetical protein [Rhodospirillum sp.]MCF8489642.1 hypothetical protein [Rhodospirillum sp.]MCF8500554.1 hypothetical protein [Rhodospirillum sp.]
MADFDLTTAMPKTSIEGTERIPVSSGGVAAAVTVDQVHGYLVDQIEPLSEAATAARDAAVAAKAVAETVSANAVLAQAAAEDARTGALAGQAATDIARDAARLAQSGAETARDAALFAQSAAETAQALAEATDAAGALLVDGSRALTGALSFGGNRGTSLAEPEENDDAATRKYVDQAVSTAIGASGGGGGGAAQGGRLMFLDETQIALTAHVGGTMWVPNGAGGMMSLSLSSPITGSNSGLAPGAGYHVYLPNTGGALDIVETAPQMDAATGVLVKTGDATRLFVGTAIVTASGGFQWDESFRSVWTMYNGGPQYLWAAGSAEALTSNTWTQVTPEMCCAAYPLGHLSHRLQVCGPSGASAVTLYCLCGLRGAPDGSVNAHTQSNPLGYWLNASNILTRSITDVNLSPAAFARIDNTQSVSALTYAYSVEWWG